MVDQNSELSLGQQFRQGLERKQLAQTQQEDHPPAVVATSLHSGLNTAPPDLQYEQLRAEQERAEQRRRLLRTPDVKTTMLDGALVAWQDLRTRSTKVNSERAALKKDTLRSSSEISQELVTLADTYRELKKEKNTSPAEFDNLRDKMNVLRTQRKWLEELTLHSVNGQLDTRNMTKSVEGVLSRVIDLHTQIGSESPARRDILALLVGIGNVLEKNSAIVISDELRDQLKMLVG